MDNKLMGVHTMNTIMNQKTERSATTSSRRYVLKTLGGVIAAGLSIGSVNGQQESLPSNNTIRNISKERIRYSRNTLEHNMKEVPAYVTDPGFSLTALLANLPYVLTFSDGPTPIILMDTYDYNRLRGRVMRETDNEKVQYLGMAYEELRRQDIIYLRDYAKMYSPAVQQQTLQQNQAIIEDTPEWVHQKAAVQGAKGLEKYWGEHQRSFRSNLGEDPDSFAEQRDEVVHQRKKMEQGLGDPIDWNQNVLNEYATALKICRSADQVLNLNVKGVIGQGDSELLRQIINSADSRRNTANVSHIEANGDMFGFNHSAAKQTRKRLDHIGKIATDVAEVQHEDWSFLGSTLALPKFTNFDHIKSQIRGSDEESLIEEAREALAVIKRRADNQSLDQAQYMANWMGEQYDLPQSQHQELTKEFSYAFELVDHSQDLRDLGEGDKISRPAFFLVASVLSDPTYRYETDSLYRHARDLLNQLGPSSVTETQLETYRQRGDYLRGETSETAPDWFEDTDRAR